MRISYTKAYDIPCSEKKINFLFTLCGYHITAIIPVFQTGDTGSTPVIRSLYK